MTLPPLYHVTTADAATSIREAGYRATDWASQADAWGLDVTTPETWAVSDVYPSVVATALAERVLGAERLDGHPSRSPAAFFYTNPSMARYAIQKHEMGTQCVVIDPSGLDAPLAQSPLRKVQAVFRAVQQAVSTSQALDLDCLTEQVTEYWRHVSQWSGNTNPRIEVFVPTAHLSADHVVDILDATALSAHTQREGYEKHPAFDNPYKMVSGPRGDEKCSH